MSDEHQPEAVWVFPEKKSNKARIWLIVGLGVAALIVVGLTLFFLLNRDEDPQPTPTPTESVSATPTATPAPTPTPTEEPAPTPPPVPDPDLSTFAGQVQPWLDDAITGLGFMADASGEEAVQIVDTLQQDADRLSSAAAPSSIATEWYDAAGDYSARLDELRSAAENGSGTQSALDGAEAALQTLRDMVGL